MAVNAALTTTTAIDRYSLLNNEGCSVLVKKCIVNSVGCTRCNFVRTCARQVILRVSQRLCTLPRKCFITSAPAVTCLRGAILFCLSLSSFKLNSEALLLCADDSGVVLPE